MCPCNVRKKTREYLRYSRRDAGQLSALLCYTFGPDISKADSTNITFVSYAVSGGTCTCVRSDGYQVWKRLQKFSDCKQSLQSHYV